MTINQRGRAFALAAFLSAAVAAPAIAADPDIAVNANRITQSRAVQMADLDLSSAKGQRTLDQRIKIAANDVCGVFDVSLMRDHASFAQCTVAARDSARTQVAQRLTRDDTRPITVVAG